MGCQDFREVVHLQETGGEDLAQRTLADAAALFGPGQSVGILRYGDRQAAGQKGCQTEAATITPAAKPVSAR